MAADSFELTKAQYDQVLSQLSDPEVISDWERFEELTKKKNQLELLLNKFSSLQELEKQLAENEAIVSAGEDSELMSLASEEIKALKERKRILQEELERPAEQTLPSEPARAAIMELRAGVGGEEASLFARDLFEMYSGFARSQGWQEQVLDSSPTEKGGLKEVIFELKPAGAKSLSRDVFAKIRHEAGVHRVQRIPQTEKSGRVHTSTATVAVLPRAQKTEINISPADIEIEFFNATGPGGQNVNKRKTAVRIIHLPSGEVVTSRTERSQLQNKENALSILAGRLLEKRRIQQESQLSGDRRSQIGQAKRAEKIRTYNFPQDRLTDHRIKKSWHNLEEILKGNLSPVIDELQKTLPTT